MKTLTLLQTRISPTGQPFVVRLSHQQPLQPQLSVSEPITLILETQSALSHLLVSHFQLISTGLFLHSRSFLCPSIIKGKKGFSPLHLRVE